MNVSFEKRKAMTSLGYRTEIRPGACSAGDLQSCIRACGVRRPFLQDDY